MADLKQRIAAQLPYLRRYARALTGSQRIGDEHIRDCLEALLQEPDRINVKSKLRPQLYRLFHDFSSIFKSDPMATPSLREPLADPSHRRVEERLAALAPHARQALLLVHQEGFTTEDAAEILATSIAEVDRYVQEAWADLKRQPTTDVLIIEDEPLIALDVAKIVKELGHRVAGVANRSGQAIDMATAKLPGLVLADIQLEDGSTGIAAVREILKSIEVPVVFVTAYPERLLTGEGVEPAFVVTKPFESTTLKVAISQALFFAKAS